MNIFRQKHFAVFAVLTITVLAIVWVRYRFELARLATGGSQPTFASNAAVKKITPEQYDSLQLATDFFIIDVHVPEQEHLPGTDAVIAYDQILQQRSQLPTDKNTPIILYCRSGSMSAQVAEELRQLGYSNVHDLQGGADAYRAQQNNKTGSQ